jgi:hypothetical protein
MQVERLELLETKQTITEPISVLGLSTGIAAGLSFLDPRRADPLDFLGAKRADGRHAAGRADGTAPRPRATLPLTIRLRQISLSAGSYAPAGGLRNISAVSHVKVPDDSWLTANLRVRRTPHANDHDVLMASRAKPAARNAGGAQPVNHGGAPANLGLQGSVTPLRFSPPGGSAAPALPSAGPVAFAGTALGSNVGAAAPSLSVPYPHAHVPPRLSAPPPTAPNGPPHWPLVTPDASGGSPIGTGGVTLIGGGTSSPLSPFQHFPLYVLDYNYGSIHFPGFEQYATIGDP